MYNNINELKKELRQKKLNFQLLTDLPPVFEQIGETCKIVSFTTALHWLYQSNTSQYPYPPFPTKRDARKIMGPHVKINSVRDTAKKYGSQVGEIYDMRRFNELAKAYGYEKNFSYITCTTVKEYETQIIDAVEANVLVTVFIDVNFEGLPGKFNGEREHSALVIGYAQNETGQTSLILQHWGRYYVPDINAVFESSQNLQEKRNPEVFIKKNKKWETLKDAQEQQAYPIRHAHPPANDAIGMRGALLMQRSHHRSQTKSFYDTFNKALAPKTIEYQSASLENHKEIFSAGIPLDILIHFLEIDNMRLECYSIKELTLFINNLTLLKEKIIDLIIHQYNTSLRGSLCDDIIKQNPDSKRSIIELISNSIDAKSNHIKVKISDGAYTIEDDGSGMDIEIILRSLLIPKNSTKNKIEDSIGRFGLGFFTSLTHVLKDPNGSVVLETKTHHSPGYTVKFKNINKNIYITIEENVKDAIGTSITVVDSNIEKNTYESYAKQNMSCNQHKGLFINDTLVMIGDGYRAYHLGASTVYIRPAKTSTCLVSLSNILITKFETSNSENYLDVVLSLPKNATLMESRDKVLIDNKEILDAVRKIIDLCQELNDNEKIPYLNSIAPAISLFQKHNIFISNDSNLMEYLSNILEKCLSHLDKKPIPDNYLKKIFSEDDAQVVNQQILPVDWRMRVGDHCSLFESDTEELIIAKLQVNRKLYHDHLNHVLYIDTSFYHKILHENRHVEANIITKEVYHITGVWINFRKIDAASESLVKFDKHYKKPKYHELFLRHGYLSQFSDEFLDTIPAHDMDVLMQCPTLVKSLRRVDLPVDLHMQQKIYRALFEGKLYYILYDYAYSVDENSRYTFFDEHFQYVNPEKYMQLHRNALHKLSNIENVSHPEDILKNSPGVSKEAIKSEEIVINDNMHAVKYLFKDGGKNKYGLDIINKSKNNITVHHMGEHVFAKYIADNLYVTSQDNYECTTTVYNNELIKVNQFVLHGQCEPFFNFEIIYHNNNAYFVYIFSYRNASPVIISPQTQEMHILDAMLTKQKLIAFIENDNVYRVDEQNNSVFLGKNKATYLPSHYRYSKLAFPWDQSFIYDSENKSYFITEDGRCWYYPEECKEGYFLNSNQYYCIFKHNEQYIVIDKYGDYNLYQSAYLNPNNQDSFIILNNENLYYENQLIYSKQGIYDFCINMVVKMIKIKGKNDFFDLIDLEGRPVFKDGQIKFINFADEHKNYIRGELEIDNQTQFFYITSNGIIWQADPELFYSNEGYPLYPYHFSFSQYGQRIHVDVKDCIVTKKLGFYLNDGGYAEHPILKMLEPWQLKSSHVIQNLHFMNGKIFNLELYSSYLRFVDCPHLIFKKLFQFFPSFKFVPDAQQFSAYDEIYDTIMSIDKNFIQAGIIAFHQYQHILKYRPNLNMQVNFTDLIQLFGIQILCNISGDLQLFIEKYVQSSNVENIISSFSDDVREAFYYLFSNTAYVPSHESLMEQERLSSSSSYSIVQLITAITLRNDLIDKVHHSEAFGEAFDLVSKSSQHTLSQRRLRHAIYHLSDPSHPIYIRELIQNAIDACVESDDQKIRAYSYQLSSHEHVFQIKDTGRGMSLEEVFKYLILPEHSSKRGHSEFIGGRGVGLFTIFHDAKEVLIKTSKGHGETFYLQFLPQYDDAHRIYDIHVKWYKTSEISKGTLIQRISNTQHLKLETVKTMNAIRHFGRFVPSDNVQIYFNDVQINAELTHLSSVQIEYFGLCKIYQHSETIFTANGLFIRYIDDIYWEDMPPIIKNIIQKYGILVDLPPKVSLTRERSDFQSADEFQKFFKPIFACLCLQAYCRLLCTKVLNFEELPDDVFRCLEGLHKSVYSNDPIIVSDAYAINNGGHPVSFTYYFNQDRLINLLLHLSFIPYEGSAKTFSIIELSGLIDKTRIDIARLPHFIQKRIKRHTNSIQSINSFQVVVDELVKQGCEQQEIMKPWRLTEDPPSNWQIFNSVLQAVCVHFETRYQLKLNIMYSAELSYARAFVKPWHFTVHNGIKVYDIYFNPFKFESALASAFEDKASREALINELLYILSHEVTHLLENSSCGGTKHTHNNEFRQFNADIYSAILFDVNMENVSQMFKTVDNHSPCTATEFLKHSILNTPELNRKHHFFAKI